MKNTHHDLPRHQRPLWEILAFSAAFLGLLGLSSIMNKVDRFLVQKKENSTPAATAEYLIP